MYKHTPFIGGKIIVEQRLPVVLVLEILACNNFFRQYYVILAQADQHDTLVGKNASNLNSLNAEKIVTAAKAIFIHQHYSPASLS